MKLHRSQLVGSRSNIEKHGDWNLMKEDSSFGSAFASARSAGKTTFDFGGKSYTTQRAGESSSKWKSSLKPSTSASTASAPIPRPRSERPTSTASTPPIPRKRPTPGASSTNAVRPAGPASGMPAARTVTNSVRPEGPPGGLPKAKPKPNVPQGPQSRGGNVTLQTVLNRKAKQVALQKANSYVKDPKTSGATSGGAALAAQKAAQRVRDKLRVEARIYSDSEPYTGGAFNPLKYNANAQHRKRLDNYKTAQFFHKHGRTPGEKIDAAKDMAIAEKKMKYWSNQPHFDKKQGEKDHAEVNRQWSSVKEETTLTDIEEGKSYKGGDYRSAAAKKLRVKVQKASYERAKGKRAIGEDTASAAKNFLKYRNSKSQKSTADLVKAFHDKGGKVTKGPDPVHSQSEHGYHKPVKAATVNVAALKDPNGAAASKKLRNAHALGQTYRQRAAKRAEYRKATFGEEVELGEEGSKKEDHMVNCPSCKGHGRKMDRYENFDICDDCDGKGKVPKKSLEEKAEQDGVYRAKTAARKKFSQMTGHEHKGFNYWTDGKKSPVTAKNPTGKAANGKYKLRVVGEEAEQVDELSGKYLDNYLDANQKERDVKMKSNARTGKLLSVTSAEKLAKRLSGATMASAKIMKSKTVKVHSTNEETVVEHNWKGTLPPSTEKQYTQAKAEHPNVVGHYKHPSYPGKSFELRAHADGQRHVMLNTTDRDIHGGFMGDNTAHVHKTLTRDFDDFKKVKSKTVKEGVILDETRMPAGVIAAKKRYDEMTDKEFAAAHGHKTDDELRGMAWRHGYGKGAGKGSDHYLNRVKKGRAVQEGRTFRDSDEGSYSSAKAIRDKIKKSIKDRKSKDAKKNIEEDLYPEVRTLNKKKAQ